MARARSLLVAATLVLALPGAAEAATLTANKSCYRTGSNAHLTGTGFAPDSPIRFMLNGKLIDQAVTSDPAGEFTVSYGELVTSTESRLVFRATDDEDLSAAAQS